MKTRFSRVLSVLSGALVAAALLAFLTAPSWAQSSVSFGKSTLQGESSERVTSLDFGPDGRLYVANQGGVIKAYTIKRNAKNSYSVTATETISLVKGLPNHNDDGTRNTSVTNRQVTGILVKGTASRPVIYASSGDPRMGGGEGDANVGDSNLDTNSGIVSRLTWDGSKWNKLDLVRGLPRSERTHATNGMQLDESTNTLYLAVGGNTNSGATSNGFAFMPEYALSAAVLSIDLNKIGNTTYDLPTLDDEDRTGTSDTNDPFGGNDGKNQAKVVSGGPVQVYASGLRNPYDVVLTGSGKLYTVDNGSNEGWGDVPVKEGPSGVCTNEQNEPGISRDDTLHLLSSGYYGGHPSPTRGNKANTFNSSNPQSPVPTANPVECDFRAPGEKGELASFIESTNGLTEYTASNFGGAMNGNLLAAGYNKNDVYRIKLNSSGTAVASKEVLFSTVGNHPLDITAQGTGDIFPGTIWVADISTQGIVAFEPSDYDPTTPPPECKGTDDPALDEDADGFDNADEIDNTTNPCSAADVPPDNDGDKNSDLNDPDDDNDSSPDTSDPFAWDKNNGKTTNLPVNYTFDEGTLNPKTLLGLGFTGLMTDQSSNYSELFDAGNMTAGGAAGKMTVDKVPDGDAYQTSNTQKYGFQFGVNATSTTGKFTAHTRIAGPFSGTQPQDNQSMGLFIGNGDQDNYAKLVTEANGGSGGVEFTKEVNGTATSSPSEAVAMPGPEAVDLYLTVDPAANTVQPSYSVTTNGVAGQIKKLGSPQSIPSGWLSNTTTKLAVGTISTSAGPGPEFPATWDFIEVVPGEPGSTPGGDTTLPVVTKAPTQSLVARSALGATTVPVKLDWSATDAESGVAGYELQQSTDGGPWTDVTLSSPTATSATPNLEAGKTYQFQVRAQDSAGNWSGWKQDDSFKVNVFQETDTGIAYTGTWSTGSLSGAFGGSVKYASAAGASAKLTLNGIKNMAWVTSKASDRGKAEVWVDGAKVTTRDLYSSTTQPRWLEYAKNGMNASRSHTLQVKALGTQRAASSGKRVDVDALIVLSTP